MSKKHKSNKYIASLVIAFIVILFGIFETKYYKNSNILNEVSANKINISEKNVDNFNEETFVDGIKIYFFDVGQADSILLRSKDKTMLIDAGNDDDGNLIVNYIKTLGINKIDYIICTHPHEDHIGGMDDVIKSFNIGNIFMPKVKANTKNFENLIDEIDIKGLKINSPEQGEKFTIGDVNCEVMLCGSGTEEEKNNLNLSSIVIRAIYGEQSYLFMGDAEIENEKSRDWPQTNLLKVGHHGSNTSTSAKFLNQVKPQIAVISVGSNNDYGHPNINILNRLNKIGANIYRTDEKGTIIISSNGKENIVSFKK